MNKTRDIGEVITVSSSTEVSDDDSDFEVPKKSAKKVIAPKPAVKTTKKASRPKGKKPTNSLSSKEEVVKVIKVKEGEEKSDKVYPIFTSSKKQLSPVAPYEIDSSGEEEEELLDPEEDSCPAVTFDPPKENKRFVDTEATKSQWRDLMGLMRRNQEVDSKVVKKRGGSTILDIFRTKRGRMDLSTLSISGATPSTPRVIVPRARVDLTRGFYCGGTILQLAPDPEDPPEEKPRKYSCPMFKKLPGTRFCVDAFSYGIIPGIDVYFLSHFHSDHYVGLNRKFGKTLMATKSTVNLVRMKLGVDEKRIRVLDLDKVYLVQGTEVVLLDANHCPGSVMFIFRLQNGTTYLHTGDFRYTPSMLDNRFLESIKIHTLYLDTTYCDPKYDFPSQDTVISDVISLIKRQLELKPKTLIVCGSYCIGKERVFVNLAEVLGAKVWCKSDKRRVLRALEDPTLNGFLCDVERECQIHVVPMGDLKPTELSEYLKERKAQWSDIIAVKPTGWTFGGQSVSESGFSVRSYFNQSVTIIGVPYSEHSSYNELKEFVTILNPIKVQPTVNAKNTGDLLNIINPWIKG